MSGTVRPSPAIAPVVRPVSDRRVPTAAPLQPPPVPSTDFTPVAAGTSPALPKLSELFASIPANTAWKDLRPEQRALLLSLVGRRLSEFEAEWGVAGLETKREALKTAPTSRQKASFNAFVRTVFDNQLPDGFTATRSIKNPELLQSLKDFFLAKYAQARSFAEFYGGTARDFDGTAIEEIPLPSKKALRASEALAARALSAAKRIPESSLTVEETNIRERLLVKLQSHATGSLGGYGIGGDDLLTPYGRSGWSSDVMLSGTPAEGDVYKNERERFLKDLTTWFLAPVVDSVNAGTVRSTLEYGIPSIQDPQALKDSLGDPATDVRAKAYLLLSQWFGQRLQQDRHATQLGWDLSHRAQTRKFDSFQADQLIPLQNQLDLTEYKSVMARYFARQTTHFQKVATAAVDALFPRGATGGLTGAQRAQVDSAIAGATLGGLQQAITTALDQATGGTEASASFQAALASTGSVGGYGANGTIPAADEATIQALWTDVKAFLTRHYSGGTVDLAALLPDKIHLTTQNSTHVDQKGEFTLGLGNAIALPVLASQMLHEAKHSLDARSGVAAQIEGGAIEGGGLLVEQRIAPSLIAELYANDPLKAGFGQLSLIDSDLRLGARSEANIAVHEAPKHTDAIALVQSIGLKWNVPPEGMDTLVHRSFNGLQYANYLFGSLQYGALLDWLQQEVQPTQGRPIDPFLLLAYGVPVVGHDATSVSALKKALGVTT
jgi:hypothetical protein